ncbi:MAG: histidine phosphatase family protein [Anaerolineales bacterium]|nr:histidine phosphatase family protein [Anaerolineales bacterium]
MKNLLLMRHAKSSWNDAALSDHQRPLNKRGKHDAPRMGKHLKDQGIVLDAILCSTAVRARETAAGFLQEYTFEGDLVYLDDLYHAGPEMIIAHLTQLPDSVDTAMVIAHNPGLEDVLETVCNEYEHMSTASIAHIKYSIEQWVELRKATSGELLHLWKPREL